MELKSWLKNIRVLMFKRKVTTKLLAEKMGISRTYVSSMINGNAKITDERFEQIAKILGSTVYQIKHERIEIHD